MKKVLFSLFVVALLSSCTTESLEDYEKFNTNQQKIQTPAGNGVYMEEIDKDKVQRPGSQGDN